MIAAVGLKEVREASRPPVLAIVPHLHASCPTRGAVSALLGCGYPYLTVLVVDSIGDLETGELESQASEGRSAGATLELVHPEERVGLAAALNLGLRRARELGSSFVAMSHPAARPETGCIDRLVDALLADSSAAAAGPAIEGTDGGGAVFVDVRPFGLRFGVASLGLRRRRPPRTGNVAHVSALPRAVRALSPAFALYRVSDLGGIAPLDEKCFLSPVEVELAAGLRAQRRRLLHLPWARAELLSSPLADEIVQGFFRAACAPRLLRAHGSPMDWLLFLVIDLVGLLPRLVVQLFRPRGWRLRWAQTRGLLRGLLGSQPGPSDLEQWLNGRRVS